MPEIECLIEAGDILGEGVIWHPQEQALYWCDNLKSSVQRYDPKTRAHTVWPAPEEVGCLVFREQGGICAAMKSGFAFIDDLENFTPRYIVDPEPGLADNRMNDGKCDRAGRFWCGSMHAGLSAATASLYRLDPDLECHKMDSGIVVSNGIAWSPDDKTMYFADSRAEACYAYDYDIATGAIANRRVFIDTSAEDFRIDGATVDSAGRYWCAEVHGWSIGCYEPDGTLVQRIKMPVRQPTMCTFGGPDLETLYVVSARRFMEPGDEQRQPLAGALFAIHGLDARGLVEPFFKG